VRYQVKELLIGGEAPHIIGIFSCKGLDLAQLFHRTGLVLGCDTGLFFCRGPSTAQSQCLQSAQHSC